MTTTPFAIASLILGLTATSQPLAAQAIKTSGDPRIGLKPGLTDAGQAAKGLTLVANRPRPGDFTNAGARNSDLAFQGNLVFQGNYFGFQIWDITAPANPTLRTSILCPGNQGDPSVFGKLLFISIQATSGRLDCGPQGVTDTVSAERFRGVRIYDLSDLDHPKAVATVQTCRGSHTHTLVTDPKDPATIYVYVSGTSVVRPGAELTGCSGRRPEEDPNTSLFQIEIIRVPLDHPEQAAIVSRPRLFAGPGGAIAGLAKGGNSGEGTQTTSETNQCHDITAYPELGIAAGACSGNGILLDIRDPANPKRLTEVSDPNFAYWHSATFNNDATTILFTDEWGGGSAPRCRATDRPQWGADALYRLADGKLSQAGFYKLPVAQTDFENCVAHNGSLIPVPGRDIFVQAWYQGGISVVDITDPAHPEEIAYFDRGPTVADKLGDGGHWSAYWYNGLIYGSEIARGLDVLDLVPTDRLSQNEIDAAKLVRVGELNVQLQRHLSWPTSFVVARAYLDQLRRSKGLSKGLLNQATKDLTRAEGQDPAARTATLTGLRTKLDSAAGSSKDGARARALARVVADLARGV